VAGALQKGVNAGVQLAAVQQHRQNNRRQGRHRRFHLIKSQLGANKGMVNAAA